jgi:hypothetical protein
MNKRFLIPLSLLALAVPVYSFASPMEVAVEPIVGYERIQKFVPTAHSKDRLIYGARARAGHPLLSAEAEYTRGTDSESFPTQNLSTEDTDDKLKLGIRSSVGLARFFAIQLRAGGQAKRNTHSETVDGVTTTTVGNIVYSPYAGLGLSAQLARNLELSGSLTAVFNSFPDMSKNDYQTTLGLMVHFP